MSTASASVQALSPADLPAWRRLWRAYLEFYRAELDEAVWAATWGRLLDDAEPMWGALAIRGGTAVGLAHWIRHRSCWTVGDYCYLQDLYVDADARGHGVGRTLIEHVKEAARRDGCSRVHWLTHETNAEAMRLYDKVGSRSGFLQYRVML